jgi:pullulanase
MKKMIVLIFGTLLLFSMGLAVQASETPTTLIVHYYRYDDNYENFNMWIWENEPVARGGIQHDFDPLQKDARGVYLEIDLETDYPGATRIGIIIKQGGWDGYREIGGDRFIALADLEVTGGVAHAWFVEQDINIGLSQADLDNNIPDYRDKILIASFDVQKRISATLTAVPALGYDVYEDDALILSGDVTTTTPVISVPGVDISKTYKLVVHFSESLSAEKTVSLQNLYDTQDFEDLYTYEGTLGVSFSGNNTIFRLWAPLSESVVLNLYNQGHPDYDEQGQPSEEHVPVMSIPLDRIDNGAWETIVTENVDFMYYTFSVTNGGVTNEVTDPYAYSTGANGQRGLIVNFDAINPEGWSYGDRPQTISSLTDYIIYELHVRDLTTHDSWNGSEEGRGKFLGLSETGTTYSAGELSVTTGLDHIADLGVNAVQLLPIFDFGYVDEIEAFQNPNYTNIFNWGYMPYHFNTLEGSYSTNPFDGRTRINEFKQAVMALHDYDMRVIMDVVYNHTGESETSNFHKIVPGYYHRLTPTGGFSNGSGTGNETASERSMMRKFMLDSVEFWATEYNLSGFRFDLMALHDYETMAAIRELLDTIDPTIAVFGEPWMGGTSPLPESIRADKENMDMMPGVGAFNDVTRDGVKGSVFQAAEQGWVQGNQTADTARAVKYGVTGGISFNGVMTTDAWHLDPTQTINYVTAHDNNTLYDKFMLSGFSGTRHRDKVKAMQVQSNAIILTSQGLSFLHAGVEFMRSKPLEEGGYDHNSYESPDSVNQLRWDRKLQYNDVFEYYRDLIRIRKSYDHFRIDNASEIRSRLSFLDTNVGDNAIAYQIEGLGNDPDIVVIHSGTPSGGLSSVTLPAGKSFKLLTSYMMHDPNGLETVSGTFFVPANTSAILVEDATSAVSIKDDTVTIDAGDTFDPSSNVTVRTDLYPGATVHYSSYHDVNRPGFYTVTVAVEETFGRITHHYYTLNVKGQTFNVRLNPKN